MIILIGPRRSSGAIRVMSATGVARSDEGVFSVGTESVDSWTPGPKPLCHRHPTGPHPSGLLWTPAKGEATKSNVALIPDRRPVAPRVGAADAQAAPRIDDDAVGVTGIFVPVAPAVQQVASALQRIERGGRHAALDVERVARLADREPAAQEAGALQRLLDVAAVVDHGEIGLQVD